MTDPLQSDKSIAIQKYLQGKSLNQIADETSISKGKVHYLINDWKRKIAISNIDEIRDFIVLVRKSNISIGQCAQGFRITNILKNLGIHEGDDSVYDNDISNSQYDKIFNFIQDIYLTCKELGVTPSNMLVWIKDLLDFHYNSVINIDKSSSMIEKDDIRQDKNSTTQDSTQSSYESHIEDNYDQNVKLKNDSPEQIKIPCISQISDYIAQKKKECIELENYKKELEKDIKIEESKRKQIEFELELLKQDKKYVMTFIDWFYDLKRELWENHFIKIEDDIQNFSYLINDFKGHGYDAHKIIKEYLKAISLKAQIITHEANLQSMHNQRIDLTKLLTDLEYQVNQHTQTMNIYHQLQNMNLGLKELKRLLNTIIEIKIANNFSPDTNPVSKFLEDIEKDYDNILGFEAKVNEKKNELAKLNKELNNSRQILRFTPWIGPSLSNLFQKGISEQDIIGINQLVEICINNTNFSNSNIGPQNESNTKDTNKDNKIISRSEYWKLLTDELKKYGDIKIAIKEQQENHEKLQKEVNHLKEQKQEIINYLQIATSSINAINNEISYYKGFIDQFNKDLKYKINLSSRFSSSPIFIICNNSEKEEEEEGYKEDEDR
jgi:hypothetical protein